MRTPRVVMKYAGHSAANRYRYLPSACYEDRVEDVCGRLGGIRSASAWHAPSKSNETMNHCIVPPHRHPWVRLMPERRYRQAGAAAETSRLSDLNFDEHIRV